MAFGGSASARLQTYQTRVRVGTALWVRAIRWIVLTWVALTVWLIWHRVGLYRPQLEHAYFGRWLLCGVLHDTPGLNRFIVHLPIPINGTRYSIAEAAAWLDSRAMYGDTFYSWYWHMATGLGGYWGLGTWLYPLAITTVLLAWRFSREADNSSHLRGAQLVTPRQFERELYGGAIAKKVRGKQQTPEHEAGITLGNLVIPKAREFEHFFIVGNPGSGKSTLINQVLRQIEARGQSAIVVDRESEYTPRWYNKERGDLILNPLNRLPEKPGEPKPPAFRAPATIV